MFSVFLFIYLKLFIYLYTYTWGFCVASERMEIDKYRFLLEDIEVNMVIKNLGEYFICNMISNYLFRRDNLFT